MSTNNLGRLEKIELREAWQSESSHFTPWLAQPENLKLLEDAIGNQLEMERTEQSVGPFRADILCKDIVTGNWVLIENQLENTDHTHLGQLLTYAAGLSAATIVWIAKRFTDEHRAALDWLNEKTPEEINFFGLKLELWRIGNSPVAPKFNVVCKPNEWTRLVVKSRDNSESMQFCLNYWTGVLDLIRPSEILHKSAKPYGRQDTIFNVGWHNFVLKAYFSRPQKRGGVWVSCRGPKGLENFSTIQDSASQIERALGQKLEWNGQDGVNRGSFLLPLSGFDVDNTNDWPRQQKMFADTVVSMYRVTAPYVGELDMKSKEVEVE
jgi:hypothetical protein